MSLTKDLSLLSLVYCATPEQRTHLLTSPECTALRKVLLDQGKLTSLEAEQPDVENAICNLLGELSLYISGWKADTLLVNDHQLALLKEVSDVCQDPDMGVLPNVAVIGKALLGEAQKGPACSQPEQVQAFIKLCADFVTITARAMNDKADQTVLKRFFDCTCVMVDTLTCLGNCNCVAHVDEPKNEVIIKDEYTPALEGLDHVITMVEGTEGLLCGNTLGEAEQYVQGVLYANGIVPNSRDGNEGKILDAIKQNAQKLWDTLMNALKAIKDFFFGKKDQETQKQVLAIADKNKTDLGNADDKSVPIKEDVKASLVKMAEECDSSGEFKSAAQSLNTVSDAPSVLDKLKTLMNKQVADGSRLQKLYSDAEKKLNDLKSAMNKTSSVSDDDKETASVVKEEVTQASHDAKDSLNEAKKGMSAHQKFMNGLKRAMSNITPSIFGSAEKKDETGEKA